MSKKIKNKKLSFKKKILMTVISFCVTMIGCLVFLLYGPYNGFRDWLVTKAMTTLNHQYLATWFYSDERI